MFSPISIMSPQGTRFMNPLQIVGKELGRVALAAGVVLYALGIIQTQEIQFINKSPVISGTGTTSTQIDYLAFDRTDLTATGGAATYDIFSFSNPLTTTGSIQRFCIEVATAPTDGATFVDCGVVADGAAGTGETLFNSESLTAGIHCAVPGATEVTIGPDQRIKCASLSGTGTNLDAEGYTVYNETIIN